MKLRAIRLENVRRFTDRVEIVGIGDGLNVLSAPNEHGKSTVFDALHALFFKDRKSWDRDIRGLAPHAGGEPCVGVDAEIDGAACRIEKRWAKSRNGELRVWKGGQLFKQADEAEAWLASIVKAPKDGGPAGLLWVRQGLTSLGDDGDAGRSARRDLMSSVAGEVEAMTGGRRMDAALERCVEELGKYLTATGRVRADGPLKRLQDDVAALAARRDELAGTAERLRKDLERRRQVRRELEDLDAPEAEEERRVRLRDAREHLETARGHAEKLRRTREVGERAEKDVEQAQERLEGLLKLRAELGQAARDLEKARESSSRAGEDLSRADAVKAEAENSHAAARAAAEATADALRRATRAEAGATAAARRAELAEILRSAEAYRSQMEEAAADARRGITASVLEKLETLDREFRAAKRALEAGASWVSVTYDDGRLGAVSLDGAALAGGERVSVTKPLVLVLEGIGRLTVNPGTGADASTVESAGEAFGAALAAAHVDTLEAARASARTRRIAEQKMRDAKAALDALAPQGMDRLREALAALPEADAADADAPDRPTAEARDRAARGALSEAEAAFETARTALGEIQRRSALAEQAVETAEARLARARAALPVTDDLDGEIANREATLERLRVVLATASADVESLTKDAPDLAVAEAAFARAESVLRRTGDDRQRLRLELGQLDVKIDMSAGEAVEEELADTASRLENARTRLAALDFEVALLKRLKSALEEARASARDRYVEPVKRELVPLLRLLWDESDLRFDAEDVLPRSLIRNGHEEDYSVLSGGTREQIALLVRLAFARMLAKTGSPAPVILDDAIVYTDDDRIERVFDALTRQAQDLQILVFSCRQKAFRELGGRSLSITRAALEVAPTR